MPPIGETLREARLRQKIDVSEVETATKIRAKYIRALENDEFDRLPGPTYARTFLRTYAEFLGLDPHLLVEEYRVRHEPVEDEFQHFTASPPAARTRRRGEPAYRPPAGPPLGRGTLILGAVVAVIALFLVVGLVTGGDEEAPGPAGTEAQGGGGDGKRKDGSGGDGKRNQRQTGGGGGKVAVRVSPADATYVCVDDGEGQRVFEGTLAEPRTFRASSVRLNLGKTSAEVEVDGRRFPIEESPLPVGFEFTPEGEKPLPQGQRPCQ